jgi:hypothetical protein
MARLPFGSSMSAAVGLIVLAVVVIGGIGALV